MAGYWVSRARGKIRSTVAGSPSLRCIKRLQMEPPKRSPLISLCALFGQNFSILSLVTSLVAAKKRFLVKKMELVCFNSSA